SGSWDNTIRIWDAETGTPIGTTLNGHTSCVNSVSYSPDGNRIVLGCNDNTIHILDHDALVFVSVHAQSGSNPTLTSFFSTNLSHRHSPGLLLPGFIL